MVEGFGSLIKELLYLDIISATYGRAISDRIASSVA